MTRGREAGPLRNPQHLLAHEKSVSRIEHPFRDIKCLLAVDFAGFVYGSWHSEQIRTVKQGNKKHWSI